MKTFVQLPPPCTVGASSHRQKMPRRAYLSPQFRNLHTEQIGPSSHKNEYRNGVLVGNWAEDRLPRSTNLIGTVTSESSPAATSLPPLSSTYKAQFSDKSKLVPTQPMMKAPDLGRGLLFGHNGPSRGNHSASAVESVPPKEVARFQEKRAEWRDVKDPDAARSFTTTKTAEMDRVGQLVQRDRDVMSATKATVPIPTNFSASFVNDHQVSGLRTPFAMSQTPLVRR